MKNEKVFIVISHSHSLKKGSKTEWDVNEKVEFVNQLRYKHHSSSSAIGNYTDRVMLSGERAGMGDYEKFEAYVRAKYASQMSQLDQVYRPDSIAAVEDEVITEVINTFVDEFGNERARNVFDKAE